MLKETSGTARKISRETQRYWVGVRGSLGNSVFRRLRFLPARIMGVVCISDAPFNRFSAELPQRRLRPPHGRYRGIITPKIPRTQGARGIFKNFFIFRPSRETTVRTHLPPALGPRPGFRTPGAQPPSAG